MENRSCLSLHHLQRSIIGGGCLIYPKSFLQHHLHPSRRRLGAPEHAWAVISASIDSLDRRSPLKEARSNTPLPLHLYKHESFICFSSDMQSHPSSPTHAHSPTFGGRKKLQITIWEVAQRPNETLPHSRLRLRDIFQLCASV